MLTTFSVTFERYFPHDEGEDVCEADESGYVADGLTLRDAIKEAGGVHSYYEADCYPARDPRWFTNAAYNDGTREYYEKGISESRSLHIPKQVTAASRRRIARLLGVRVV